MFLPIKSVQEKDEDANASFMFHFRFSTVNMLEWREREHEDEDYFVGNDPGTVNSLRQCGLLKFFKIQGMRAQLRLLEYLVHMWDVDQQVFHVGAHILEIDIEDIYFLTGLSRRGARVTLTGSRGGGEPMSHYISAHCVPGAERHSGKVAIRDVCDLPLRTILYTIAHMAGSATPHMALQRDFQYALECMEPRVFNWSDGVLRSMKKQLTKCRRGDLKQFRYRVNFGVLLPGEGSTLAPTGRVGHTGPTRSKNEEVV
jgi:hypothetical protein